jgi:hypothetical protein
MATSQCPNFRPSPSVLDHPATYSTILIEQGFNVKKTLLATEVGLDDLAQDRMRQQPHRLVFIDETATTTKMTHLRGRAAG